MTNPKLNNHFKLKYRHFVGILATSSCLGYSNALSLNSNSRSLIGLISASSLAFNFWNFNNYEINKELKKSTSIYQKVSYVDSPSLQNSKLANNNLKAIEDAIEKNSEEILLNLVKNSNSLNLFNNFSYSPLIESIVGSKPKFTEILLKYGANPLQKNQNGNNAFDFALTCNETESIEHLFRHCNINLTIPNQKNFWNNYQNLLQNRFLLKLSYNLESAPKDEVVDIGCRYEKNLDNIIKISNSASFEEKNIIISALDIIKQSLIESKNNKSQFIIFEVPYYDKHIAFFVIKKNQSDKPEKLFYIDGNLPTTGTKGPGALVWQIDNSQLNNHSSDIVFYLQNLDFAKNSLEPSYDSFKKIHTAISEITINPKISEAKDKSFKHLRVPIINYKIEDCQIRSHNILTKLIISETNPNLSEENIKEIYDKYLNKVMIEDRIVDLLKNLQELPLENNIWTEDSVLKIQNLSEKIIKVATSKIENIEPKPNDFDNKILKSAIKLNNAARLHGKELLNNKFSAL